MVKAIAVQRFLPSEIQEEVKGLLSLSKTEVGDDIYIRGNAAFFRWWGVGVFSIIYI